MKIIIELEIEGDPSDAYRVVEELLDDGAIQDEINDHNVADAGELRVTSAIMRVPVHDSDADGFSAGAGA